MLAYFPFVYLPVVAQLRRLDPALEDIAATLGKPPARVFLKVVLPQLRLAICGGALLIALHLLAEYGLYVLIRYDTLTVAIVNQFQAVYDGPAANLMGIVLVALALGLLGLEAWLRGDRRYARVGGGAARVAPLARLGKLAALDAAARCRRRRLPSACRSSTLLRWLWIGGADAWHWPALAAAAGQTALYALARRRLASASSRSPSRGWRRARRSRLQRALESIHFYVGALPGVIVALALVAMTVRVALPLYQTVATLLVAYVLLFLPRAIVSVRASLAQVPRRARARRRRRSAIAPLKAALGTTLRLAAPGIAAGMALVAMGITTELTATLMLVADRHRDAGDRSSGRAPASSTMWARRPLRSPWCSSRCRSARSSIARRWGDRPMSVLSIRGLGKRFGSVVALDDVEPRRGGGSRTAVVGPSGSGKTTLLRLIAGFEAPDTGEIEPRRPAHRRCRRRRARASPQHRAGDAGRRALSRISACSTTSASASATRPTRRRARSR